MALPAPHLDDRTFQNLVDEAKRMVQQRCPEWTDHNVSDPGVTLIETFAYMVDQLLWRLNRVPDKVYVKFLELLGLQLLAPSAAKAPVTFWLTAPIEETVTVPSGTVVATQRTETEPVEFTTLETLEIVPSKRQYVATIIDNLEVNRTELLDMNQPFHCFDNPPKPGDCFYIGLDVPVPSLAVRLSVSADIEGVGVDPEYPPVVWEAYDGESWVECEVQSDTTGGLNRDGEIVLHVPRSQRPHAALLRLSSAWLRCRVLENAEWQPAYSAPPRIHRLNAETAGGTATVVNAAIVRDEIIGISEGLPAQRFTLKNRPVVASEAPYVVEISTVEEGWTEWHEVKSFAESRPDDRHFQIDESAGEVVFGPSVRLADGELHHYGAVPPKGAPIRIREYRVGGGRRGNVARGKINRLANPIPFIGDVENRDAAVGGTDAEDIENAKTRGPILLRTRERAVTANDYENLALAATKEIARARAIPAGRSEVEAGAVHVLLVPRVEDGPNGSLEFAQLVPADDVMERVRQHLDERRTVGARVLVRSAKYISVSLIAALKARHRAVPREIEEAALAALYGYFHPLRGGPDGTGWPFGRAITTGEVFSVLQSVRGVEFVEDVRLYPANPFDGTREQRTERIDLGPDDLVFSFGHQVMVQSS